MKRSECECQTGESPNTSVIIVTPSSPRLWTRLESCQRLFSGLVPGCPYCFNTPNTLASLHQHVHCGLLNSPFHAAWMTVLLHICLLLTNDGPLSGLGWAAGLRVGKTIPVNTVLFLRISKGCKSTWRHRMLESFEKSGVLIQDNLVLKTNLTERCLEGQMACVTLWTCPAV